MAEFKFDEENTTNRKNRDVTQKGFAGILIKWGLAKNVGQANLYLIAILVICFGITIYNIARTF